jgi:hypothetical protein
VRREAKAPVRRDERPDLEHELVPVSQREPGRPGADATAVSIHADGTGEAEQRPGGQPQTPDREEIAEARAAREAHDAGRVERPDAGAAARTDDPTGHESRGPHADPRRHHDHAAAREELDMHALARDERAPRARSVHARLRAKLRPGADRRRNGRKHALYASALFAALFLTGCGGGSSGSLTVGAARTYSLSEHVSTPGGPGTPTHVVLKIVQPDGTPLTQFKHGPGPHTGVHVIFVRRDLADIVHRHPPIAADGTIRDTVTFPAGGPYHLVVDVYPRQSKPQPNFQLFGEARIPGTYEQQPLPRPSSRQTIDGYTFTLHGKPALRAIDPSFLQFTVSRPDGSAATFRPWYGALAHAIFFRAGTLDYFHTHVCAPGASGCTSVFGGAKVTGTSATPGRLTVGVLVPVAGTWRLFLQCLVDGRTLTAPFTLNVR